MSAVCPNGHTSQADDYCDTCGSPIDAAAQPPAAAASTTGSGSLAPQAGSSLDLDPAGMPSAAAGAPAPSAPSTPGTAPTALECPNCGTENPDGALFCEACGYDFTTGAMPRDAAGGAGEAGEADGPDGAGDGASTGASDGAPEGGSPATAPAPAAGSATETFDWLAEVWVDPDWYQTQHAEDPCPSPGLPTIMPLRHRSVLLGRVSTSRNTHPEIDLSSDPGVSRRHAQLTTDGSRWFVEDLGSSNGTFVGPAAGPLPDQPIAVGPRTELGDDDRLYVGAWTRVVVRRATPDEVEAYA